MSADNKSLGRFILDGIPPAPRGMPQIEVTFDIDSNGILNVTAKDKATGKEQQITIKNATNLNEEEIEKMRKEAETNAKDDEEKRQKAEARNNLDNAVFAAEKMTSDLKDKLGEEDRKKLEEEIKSAKEVLAKPDFSKEECEEKTKSITGLTQEISTKLYQKGQKQGDGQGEEEKKEPGGQGEDQPEEGEIVN